MSRYSSFGHHRSLRRGYALPLSFIYRRLPEPFQLPPAFLRLDARPAGGGRHLRLAARGLGDEGLGKESSEAFESRVAISALASGVAGHDPETSSTVQPSPQAPKEKRALIRLERTGAQEVPNELDSGRRRVDVLPAGSPGSCRAELNLTLGNRESIIDDDAIRHGRSSRRAGLSHLQSIAGTGSLPFWGSVTFPPMYALGDLEAYLRRAAPTLLGYSGGVDSALLAVAAVRSVGRGGILAVIGRSDSYPAAQYRIALHVAERFGIPLLELETRELEDARYRANPTNRCYFCKTELWARLAMVARERGFATVLDGTNADDLAEHRPGLAAAGEWRVASPLAELGWTKAMVREAARWLDIPIWDAPASPCLASRIRYGVEVTPARLAQVEAAEAFLRELGLTGDLRVRHLGDGARVEVALDQLPAARASWERIAPVLHGLGFGSVELDPQGYRRGSLLAAAEA